jgi:hypothetical protein
MRSDTRAKLRKHLLKRGVCIAKHNTRITLSNILFDIIQEKEQREWTNEDLIAAINEIKGPLNTGSLRDRLNPTRDGLAMGSATGLESD